MWIAESINEMEAEVRRAVRLQAQRRAPRAGRGPRFNRLPETDTAPATAGRGAVLSSSVSGRRALGADSDSDGNSHISWDAVVEESLQHNDGEHAASGRRRSPAAAAGAGEGGGAAGGGVGVSSGMSRATAAAAAAEARPAVAAPSPTGLLGVDVEQQGPGEPPYENLPPRVHFCPQVEAFIHGYDHYCGVLATPIGEANHCRFWWFLFFQTLTVALALAILVSSFQYEKSWSAWYAANSGAFWTSLFMWPLGFALVSLLGFHTWLACTNATGYEMLHYPHRIWYMRHLRFCDLPFSAGIVHNLRGFCCLRDAMCAQIYGRQWKPHRWHVPTAINRDSDDVLENCWENRYYSCC